MSAAGRLGDVCVYAKVSVPPLRKKLSRSFAGNGNPNAATFIVEVLSYGHLRLSTAFAKGSSIFAATLSPTSTAYPPSGDDLLIASRTILLVTDSHHRSTSRAVVCRSSKCDFGCRIRSRIHRRSGVVNASRELYASRVTRFRLRNIYKSCSDAVALN